jgi:hypothetical protein
VIVGDSNPHFLDMMALLSSWRRNLHIAIFLSVPGSTPRLPFDYVAPSALCLFSFPNEIHRKSAEKQIGDTYENTEETPPPHISTPCYPTPPQTPRIDDTP